MDESFDPVAHRAKVNTTLRRVEESFAEATEQRRRDNALAELQIGELKEYDLDVPRTAADWHMLAYEHGLNPMEATRSDIATAAVTWARRVRKETALRRGSIDDLTATQAAVYELLTAEYQTATDLAAALGKYYAGGVRRTLTELAALGWAEKGPHGKGYRRI